jgi:hypothetical protein
VRPGIEIRAAAMQAYIEPSWFCFVEERRILAPHVSTYIAPPARNGSLILITQNVTHYTVIQNRIINRGVPVERIERVMAQPVPRMRIVGTQAPEAMHRTTVREREREVVFFRPATPPATMKTEGRAQVPQSTSPSHLAPGPTLPQRQRLQQQQPQIQQQQGQERQRALQQPLPPQVQQQQALERQRAMFQQQYNRQPPPPQGVPPSASQPPRAATQRAPEQGKEQYKNQQQSPQAQPPGQQ